MKKRDSIRRFSSKKIAGFHMELTEAAEYFVNRFEGEDVTISMSGRVIRVSGGFSGPKFEVTRHDGGWMVIRRGRRDKPEVVVRAARSYERAAIAIEKGMGWASESEA
jgi:hypothetical protein